MNLAVIFAGGSGTRMNTKSRPKQFLELNGKPIIIYTIELFDNHPDINGIIVVCIESWIPFLEKQLRKFEINKVVKIVPGGNSGQESIYNGLEAAEKYVSNIDTQETIVLIHDGVRPLITETTITDNIKTVRESGSCITCVPATETIVIERGMKEGSIFHEAPPREKCFLARAPQSFYLRDIMNAHRLAIKEHKTDFVDSCSLMKHYGYRIVKIMGPVENIKITTPTDFFIFRAMVQVHENQQIFGY